MRKLKRRGFIFKVLNSKSEISEDPFVGSAIANRLALHLRSAGIYDGETMHSLITLSLLGVPSEDVAGHVGSKTDKVMNSDSVAASLATSTAPRPIEVEPLASVVTRAFCEKNDMKNLFLAFP